MLEGVYIKWQTAYHYYFRVWRLDGTWERMHDALRERVRVSTSLKRAKRL
jgi:transposase